MAKKKGLSGFPEWLPEQRMVEQRVLDDVRRRFELHGFAPIETRAVEPLDALLQKGETDKEIYVLRRLQADGDGDSGIGLHFDLTVPFARYVMQHRGELAYPFKRYQIQKAWRGERPQTGRFREFLQADADVVDQDSLSLHFDAEMARLLVETIGAMPVPEVVLGINNRKLLEGFYRGLGIENVAPVLRVMDKIDKIGADGVRVQLARDCSLDETAAEACLALGRIRAPDDSFVDEVRALGVAHTLLDEGLEELVFVMDALSDLPAGSFVANLSIARGLDYYTGTVFEGVMPSQPRLGTVCSGGRYDNLVGAGSKLKLPGVGVSIGITRILSVFFQDGSLSASRRVPTCVLVTLPSADALDGARAVASALRDRGVATEVFHDAAKFGKQIKYAQKRGIPYVWFPPQEPGAAHEVKRLADGSQTEADPTSWLPSDDDREPRIVRRPAP